MKFHLARFVEQPRPVTLFAEMFMLRRKHHHHFDDHTITLIVSYKAGFESLCFVAAFRSVAHRVGKASELSGCKDFIMNMMMMMMMMMMITMMMMMTMLCTLALLKHHGGGGGGDDHDDDDADDHPLWSQ